ncbi:HupE/UreJ family protein [Acidiluteibacter ferrifornacis]|uniref:HupE/UreJ family protein n=1 Tax=Acidiluteibacter ferrifornacis TaxID=2692424 RepID=A0A6N9NKD6_9FLAO|nr:HupE/UreJ family protein [Acidiluteibacter ferrifornacis]NBG65931.1 HupE/UreJ family protein [Acidiluteibacter ferrifornacis]
MDFGIYFTLGLEHITDINGFDHMLFIAALMAPFAIKDYKQILILVTAFTVGHSLTLALASLKIIPFNPTVIELLIPVTIFITGIYNLIRKESATNSKTISYLIALIFGLIHGMGFSNFFQSLLGKESSIVKPLFAFNLGVEAGQILFVFILLSIQFLLLRILKFKFSWWKNALSTLAVVVSAFLFTQQIIS